MYDLSKEQKYPFIVFCFFIFLIFFGSLLLIQVFLAIFDHSFSVKAEIQNRERKNKKLLKLKKSLEQYNKAQIGDKEANVVPGSDGNIHTDTISSHSIQQQDNQPVEEFKETHRQLTSNISSSKTKARMRKAISLEPGNTPSLISPNKNLKRFKTVVSAETKSREKQKIEDALKKIQILLQDNNGENA